MTRLATKITFERRVYGLTQQGAARPVTYNAFYFDTFDPWVMESFAATMLYESSGPPDCVGRPFSECIKPIPDGVRHYPATRFAALAVNLPNASEMRRWVDGFLHAGYGTLCLLGVSEREYTELPSFFEEEVA